LLRPALRRLSCVLSGPTRGAADWRWPLEMSCAGSPRRPVCGGGLRRITEACVRARDGPRRTPPAVIHNQLGDCHPGITSIYLQGIDTREMLRLSTTAGDPGERRPPANHEPSASGDWHISRALASPKEEVNGLSPESAPRLSEGGNAQCPRGVPITAPRLVQRGCRRRCCACRGHTRGAVRSYDRDTFWARPRRIRERAVDAQPAPTGTHCAELLRCHRVPQATIDGSASGAHVVRLTHEPEAQFPLCTEEAAIRPRFVSVRPLPRGYTLRHQSAPALHAEQPRELGGWSRRQAATSGSLLGRRRSGRADAAYARDRVRRLSRAVQPAPSPMRIGRASQSLSSADRCPSGRVLCHERTRDWSASSTNALAMGPPRSPREALYRSVSAG
jgi:hypothetical protein